MRGDYEPPAHKGDLPEAEVEGGKVHTGSCHCGKVTVAVKSKPIDETFGDLVNTCNCSICERVSPLIVLSHPHPHTHTHITPY
jgi:hypothetical protein